MEKNNKRNRTILRDFAASREHSLLTRLAPQAILILPSILLIIMTLKPAFCQDPSQLADYWKQNHFAKIIPSDLSYAGLKSYLDQLRTGGLSVAEVGKSYGGRAIYKMDFGNGPFKVFMWSQMHGDEPTATCALLDLFYFLQQNRHLTLVENISRKITLRAVPMLNPDGAELYQRRNMQGIDINRDAQALVTPEGQVLKKLRDEWSPDVAFNLHNQDQRTAVGDTAEQATISLLAVPFDEKRSVNPGRILTKKLCSVIAETLSVFIKGHIARYDDTFNPRAFGDLMTKWGSPVVLIETGGLRGRNEEYLVQLNFIAYIAALNALATDSIRLASTDFYDRLPYNNEGAFFDLLIRNATIVDRSQTVANNQPMRLYVADIGINKNFMPARASTSKSRSMTTINNVGDLAFVYGLDEVDARGWYVTIADGADGANRIGGANDRLRPGADAILLFYRKDRGEQIDWSVPGLESRYPPDALYRQGAWVGREKLNSIK